SEGWEDESRQVLDAVANLLADAPQLYATNNFAAVARTAMAAADLATDYIAPTAARALATAPPRRAARPRVLGPAIQALPSTARGAPRSRPAPASPACSSRSCRPPSPPPKPGWAPPCTWTSASRWTAAPSPPTPPCSPESTPS